MHKSWLTALWITLVIVGRIVDCNVANGPGNDVRHDGRNAYDVLANVYHGNYWRSTNCLFADLVNSVPCQRRSWT